MKVFGLDIPEVKPCVRYYGILTLEDKIALNNMSSIESYSDDSSELNDIINILGRRITRLLIADPEDFVVSLHGGFKFNIEFQYGSSLDSLGENGHGYQKMIVGITPETLPEVSKNKQEGSFCIVYDDLTGRSEICDNEYGTLKEAASLLYDICFGEWDYTDECRKTEEKELIKYYLLDQAKRFLKKPQTVFGLGCLALLAFSGFKKSKDQ